MDLVEQYLCGRSDSCAVVPLYCIQKRSEEAVTKKEREAKRVLESAFDEFTGLAHNLGIERMEVGRSSDPCARAGEKGYENVLWIKKKLPCSTAAPVEQAMIDVMAEHPAYDPGAARHSGGGCPARGGQYVYLMWDGEPLE